MVRATEEYLPKEEFVTKEGLEEKIRKSRPSFLQYIGKTIYDSSQIALATAIAGSALIYGTMSCAYGPYDTGKIIYSELSGNEGIKHTHMEEAKALYARRSLKQELVEIDLRNLYAELGVVNSSDNTLSEDDVSWYNLLDWIEDQD